MFDQHLTLPQVSVLLRHGAAMELQNESGMTALHIAVSEGHIEVAKLLVRAGAPRSVRNKLGRSVLDEAEEDPELLLFLVDKANVIGVVGRPELNGGLVRILEYSESKGRYTVVLHDEESPEKLALKPQNLQLKVDTIVHLVVSAASEDAALLHKLRQAETSHATIESHDANTGEYVVKTLGRRERGLSLRVRPEVCRVDVPLAIEKKKQPATNRQVEAAKAFSRQEALGTEQVWVSG